jgi:hypothetical protein
MMAQLEDKFYVCHHVGNELISRIQQQIHLNVEFEDITIRWM